jgi:putative salt-induced outer membrane protein YdiY
MGLRALAIILFGMAGVAPAFAQLSSPPPVAGRSGSGAPLSENFGPDTLFPKKSEPPPKEPAPVIPLDADPGEILPAKPRRKIWSGSGDVGLNGAYGNSDFVNLRGGYNLRRKTETNALTSDFQYVFSQQNGSTRTSQALFNVRDEILFRDSRWSPFGATQVEYDEFRAYRFRVGVYAGTGYRLIDENGLTFKLRAGAGATREIGSIGNPDRWVPEFLFGYDFRYKINDRSTLISYFDYYPRMEDFRQYRLRARIAYEFVLDPELALIYRIGVQDRYDSDPGNAERNDVTFFTTIGLKF